MALELTVVDAFTDVPFHGNPAAVALVDAFPDDGVMQAVAREMNLSETAFVAGRGRDDYDLRWFTPAVEVDLCGHATLASAHVLGGSIRFHTRSGPLSCRRVDKRWIEMDFPADAPEESPVPDVLDMSGVRWYGRGRFAGVLVLDDAALVRQYRPDLGAIASIGTTALIVTAPGDGVGFDCVSRVFGPNVGIPEDPVTGSAHCTLAEYWGGRLGSDVLVGEQASSRGGVVRMRRMGERVAIGGQAVTTAHVRLAV